MFNSEKRRFIKRALRKDKKKHVWFKELFDKTMQSLREYKSFDKQQDNVKRDDGNDDERENGDTQIGDDQKRDERLPMGYLVHIAISQVQQLWPHFSLGKTADIYLQD
jgi:hypothetical protein